MPPPIQVLLIDLDDAMAIEDIAGRLPAGRAQLPPLTLTTFGAQRITRPGNERGQVHWDGIAQAVVRLVTAARAMRPEGEQPEFWIAGRAPLPVFAHLGSELSAWATPPVLLNRRKDGVWDIVTTGATANDPAVFFDVRTDLASSPAESTGRVAVFVSTLGTPPQRDALRSFVVARGDDLAGIVELRTGGPEYLTGENAGRAAEELAQVVSQLPGAYPHAEGIALFVAGPAHLAFLAGRAINANMLRDVLIPNFRTGEYEDALRLPWRGATPRALSLEPEDEKDRNAVLALLRDGIRGAMDAVEERDVPTFVARAEASAFLKHLRGIDLSDEWVLNSCSMRYGTSTRTSGPRTTGRSDAPAWPLKRSTTALTRWQSAPWRAWRRGCRGTLAAIWLRTSHRRSDASKPSTAPNREIVSRIWRSVGSDATSSGTCSSAGPPPSRQSSTSIFCWVRGSS